MEDKQDFLAEFSDEKAPLHGKYYQALAICYCCHFIIATLVFVGSLWFYTISLDAITGSVILLLQVVVVRGLPLVSLILLLKKKRAGWHLCFCLNSMEAIQKLLFAVGIIQLAFRQTLHFNVLLLTGIFLLLILSVANIVLLLTLPVKTLFGISKKAVIINTLIAVCTFLLIKFYIANLLIRLITPA